jgi:hypothetical protein
MFISWSNSLVIEENLKFWFEEVVFQHKLSSLVLFGALSKPQFKRTKMQYSSSMPKEFGKRRQKKKEREGEEKEEEKSKDMHYNKDN